ncbi:MAG: T9SS type A sorting domain-containing protein, partial [Bacteroidota bacterium]
EFARFLRDENIGNPYDWNQWGEKVYEMWQRRGAPTLMARQSASVLSRPPKLSTFQDFDVAVQFSLAQNYPNPFNSETTIEYWVSNGTHAVLELYDLRGQLVRTLVDGIVSTGLLTTRVDASGLPSGVYFYRMTIGKANETRKMILLR